ncbi:hypothetical protein ANN_02669 [Periplaneta americana]|uniref:Tc1-like transposase DDE domain-containing protein n=1 Tax=Periplaneta americana TaxID=6978 RepID=A0ABQ8TWZ3_PERAM|nr:hypothetical protein ANN_02669 [Periplaneta americana]
MEILGEAQAVDRLAFATNRVDFDWRNVIFSDETTISSDYEGAVRVYREDGLRHDQRYVHRRERSGRFGISCWGWMSYDGPGQDNHPVHYAASIQRWFQRRPEIKIINWPPKSPDLNVLEHIWAELKKRRIATYAHRRPQNRDELWNQVVDTWEDLVGGQNLFHNLVTFMPDRLRAVIEADVFFDSQGLMHHEFIPEGQYCNERIYVETLRRLWDAVRRKRPEKWVENNWFLMHDNAPAHRAIIVKNFLARHNITALDHSPYSPVSPPDYFLFPRLKSHLKGRRFNAEEVIAN